MTTPSFAWPGRRPARQALLASLALALLAAPAPLDAAPPVRERQLSGSQAVAHAVSRLAFGHRPGMISEVTRIGWEEWAQRQLLPEMIDDSILEERLRRDCPSIFLSLSELQVLSRVEGDAERNRIKNELRMAMLLRAVNSERQFQEVIVDFWRNHLSVDVNKVPFLATHYEEHVLRKHAFGRFSDLLMASAKHPAMLVFLDNYVSNRTGVNENYARELMELHTLGVDNGYTQADVEALARVLTGWTCGWRSGPSGEEYDFYFDPNMHESSPAVVVGLEMDGQGGMMDGQKAIRHLARHEGTSHFISLKLCRYLVNDFPPPELVERVAKVFRETYGDLRAVYSEIIFSPEFTSSQNYRAKVKTPLEFVVSAMRATAAEIESPQRLFRELELMGQPIYECLEPTGYSDQREAWLDPGVMVYRWNFAIALVGGKLEGITGGPKFVEPMLTTPPAQRPRKVMELLLPGMLDRDMERLLSVTPDPRAQTAYALGAPSFQQQ